jgi:Uma2 family endonuclease
MLEMKIGVKTVDLPYSVRLYGVAEDLFDELTDEDTKAELIDGVMIMHSPASLQHENTGNFLGGLMRFYAKAKSLGLMIASGNGIVHLSKDRKLAPDGFFIRKERVPSPLPKQFDGVPDLILEVLSPSNRNDDLIDKRKIYREAGVDEIWFVDNEHKQIIVDRKQADGYAENIVTEGKFLSNAIEGFWINVDWLWQEPLPDELTCLQEILKES